MRGTASGVSPATGFRVICYCGDCQAFARFLERPDVLDSAGGTDILQMPPARVKLLAGREALRCLRLSEKGLFRWYTDCCRTPVGNTAGPRVPLIGVIHSFWDHGTDSHSVDQALGPPVCRVNERSATAPLPAIAPGPPSFGLYARWASQVLGWWVRGLARPNAFFEGQAHGLVITPRVLTAGERTRLRGATRSPT